MSERALAVAEFKAVSWEDKLLFRDLYLVDGAVVIEDVNLDRPLDFHGLTFVIVEEDSAAETSLSRLARFRAHGIGPDRHDFVGLRLFLFLVPWKRGFHVHRLTASEAEQHQTAQQTERADGERAGLFAVRFLHG